LVELNKGDLVSLHPRYTEISKIKSKFCLFLEYGQNTSFQQLKSLSKVLIENRIIQLPTSQIKKVKSKNDTKI
jgi:hypothetical protein